MNISGTQRINAFIKKDPSCRKVVNLWAKVIREALWETSADIPKTFKHTDLVDGFWVFNIAKKLKLATKISLTKFRQYESLPEGDPAVRIFEVMPFDAEYDAAKWKTSDDKYKKLRENYNWHEELMDASYERVDALSHEEAFSLRMHTFKLVEYEYIHHPLPTERTEPGERLTFLMDENDLAADDLAKILDESPEHCSAIMGGKRQLVGAQVATLAKHFCVHPTLFGSLISY